MTNYEEQLEFDETFGETSQPLIHFVNDSKPCIVYVVVPVEHYERPELALFETIARYFEMEFERVRLLGIQITYPMVNETVHAIMARLITEVTDEIFEGDFND